MMGQFLTFISSSLFRRIAVPACAVSCALGAAVACGKDEQPVNTGVLAPRTQPATQDVTVTVEYPPDGNVQGTTNSLHVWFIEGDDAGANCAKLVGGGTDPNAGPLNHLGDVVVKDGIDAPITAKGISVGSPTLVYVEAVDDNGQVEWAGCGIVSKGKVVVTLDKARVYKCDEEGVKNGDPCDDGDPCTVGESCKEGECKNAKPRDCTSLDDDCSVGTCDPDVGCKKVAYNDGATCDDELYCTTDDTCVNGDCIGTPKNCDTNSGGCRTGSVCDERTFGECTTGTIQPYGTTCNDGKFCTTGDQCDFSGNCVGTEMDCSASGGCATCSETTHQCTEAAPSGTFCSDGNNCTTGDQCNANGQCVGQPRDCSSYNSGNGCTVGYCDPTFGSCTTRTAPSGTICDDGNPCTTGDYCSAGYCTYTTTATSGTPCDDKNPCTTGDYCSGSYCTYTTYATTGTPCGAPCTIGTCSGSSSCSFVNYAPTGTACDDGNPCTVNDMCSFGSCTQGTFSTTATCSLPGCTAGAHCGSGNCSCN